MREVVRLEHESDDAARLMMLQWALGNTCNFACSYCPTDLHDGSVRSLPLPSILRFLERFIAAYAAPRRRILIEFTGGEATMYPHYPELIKCLSSHGVLLALSSNGGRTLRYWESVARYLDHVNLTFHAEFTELSHLLAVIALLQSHSVRVHVNVMMLPSQFARCLAASEQLVTETREVSVALQALRYGIGNQVYPYTAKQREVLATTLPVRRSREANQLTKGRMVQVFSDGTREVVEPHLLVTTGKNRWRGWQCRVGLDELVVDTRGHIWAGWCQVGGRIGHVTDEAIAFPSTPVRCDRSSCDCTLDVMNFRERTDPRPGNPRI